MPQKYHDYLSIVPGKNDKLTSRLRHVGFLYLQCQIVISNETRIYLAVI